MAGVTTFKVLRVVTLRFAKLAGSKGPSCVTSVGDFKEHRQLGYSAWQIPLHCLAYHYSFIHFDYLLHAHIKRSKDFLCLNNE